ncbi:hypothetical protein BACI349Y_430055 [Bacillus sp. 349Y]|nr:hypothetical protein BACI349Y_430055 [Bacillus sp. 349Y]
MRKAIKLYMFCDFKKLGLLLRIETFDSFFNLKRINNNLFTHHSLREFIQV